MIAFGIVKPGSTLQIPFDTFVAASGANATLTNFATSDILVYKDGNTTARASTTGYTADTTFSSIAGINRAVIDLSSDATGDFFKSGSNYFVVIGSVTADGQNIYFLAATFSIGYPNAILNTSIATLSSQTSFTLTSGPAEDDALNGLWCLIHDKASAVQTTWAIVEDYTGSTKTVTLSTLPAATFTIAAIDNIHFFSPAPLQSTVNGRKLDVSTGGEAGVDWANVGSPTTTLNLSGTTVKTATDVETDTQDIQTRLPAALSGGNMKSDVLMLSGDSTAADNAELFFDGTGYTGSNNVIGLVTTVTSLTNAATAGDFTSTMKTSIGTAVAASAVASVTGNVSGNVAGSVGSVTGNVGGSVVGNVNGDVLGDVSNVVAVGAGAISLASFASDVPRLAIRTNTATAGGASTITLDAGASATNDFYKYDLIKIDSGAGAGQARFITGYVGGTLVATVNRAWTTAVDNTSVFTILPFDSVPGATAPTAAEVATAVWQDTTSGDFTVASSIGKGLYVGNIVPGAAGGHFIAGTNAATTITTALTTTFTGNLTGSVGSVTGAVGSVTGAVGSVTGNIGGDLQGTLTSTERNAIATATLARSLAAESYAADGAVPTLSQVLYLIQQSIGDFAISGTTISVKGLNGSTEVATYTIDNALVPTSRTRAT